MDIKRKDANHHEGADTTDKNDKITIVTDTGRIRLKPRIGLLGGVAFIMGAVIGSGIFISPKGALRNSGSYGMAFVIWTVTGLLAFIMAMVYAELGVLMPKSGGDYTYIRATIGGVPAFLVAWVQTTVSQPGGHTVFALVFADYLCAPIFGACGPSTLIRKSIAAAEIIIQAVINVTSVRFVSSVTVLFTLLKVLALLIITIGGIPYLVQGKVENFDNIFHGTKLDVTSISLAVYSCYWAYSGFQSLNDMAEEIVDPKKNIPKAIYISMALITAIYLTTNISYFTLLSKSEFLSASAVAYTWGGLVLGGAAFIMPISVMCSVYGAGNGGVFTNARVRFAAARAGHLPEVLSFLHHKTRMPLAAVVFHSTLSLLFLIPGDVDQLVNLTSFTGFLTNLFAIIALMIMKYKKDKLGRAEEENSFSVPYIVPVLALLICIFMLISPFVSDPNIEFLYGLGFVVSGLVFYVPFVRYSLQIPGFDHVTKFTQLVLEICPTVLDT